MKPFTTIILLVACTYIVLCNMKIEESDNEDEQTASAP